MVLGPPGTLPKPELGLPGALCSPSHPARPAEASPGPTCLGSSQGSVHCSWVLRHELAGAEAPLGISTGLGLEQGQLLYMERDLCFWGLTPLPVKLGREQPPGLGVGWRRSCKTQLM